MAATKTPHIPNPPVNREAVRQRRVQLGLTQEQLATQARVERVTIVQIETGARTNPRKATVTAIANALGVSRESLLG